MVHPAGLAREFEVERNPGYQPLVVVAVAVCAGIVLDRYLPARLGLWWLLAAGAWCVWVAAWRRRHEAAAGCAMLVCLAATGAAWHHARWSLFLRDDLGAFAAESPQPACVEAVAVRGPRRVPAPPFNPLGPVGTPDRTRLPVRIVRVRDADAWRPAAGEAMLTVDGHLLDVQPGDRLQIFGQLSTPRGPLNPGEFDFAEHLRADRRLCRLFTDRPECVTRVAAGPRWRLTAWLDRTRRMADDALSANLERARSGLALALVLGEREELDAQATNDFYETGTVHLLSISGLHVGILAFVLFRGLELGFWRRRPALLAVAAITTAYALLIDAEPPAVRATVMVWLMCLALWSGRPRSTFNLLAAAALVVIAMNPAELFRIGPQLSFMAVIVMFWVGPRVMRREAADPLARLIESARPLPVRVARRFLASQGRFLLVTTAIWLISLPLVLARFHIVSPAAIVLTPLLALPVACGLLSGFVLVACGWLIWPFSILLGWFCNLCLAFVTAAVAIADRLPGSHFWLPGPAWWWLVGFYGLLGMWAVNVRLRPPRRWCVAILAAWTALGLLAGRLTHAPRDGLECTFLAVGHGCAAFLELPDGRTLLYDAGQLGAPTAAARSVSSFLWERGRTHIDAVVISHDDVDHFNALPELLRRFSVGVVYVSPVMFDDSGPAALALRRAIDAAGIPLREIYAGDRLASAADCAIEVLHPPRRGTLGSDNANSIVLAIAYRGARLLLPGDLEAPGLNELMAEDPLDCDVLLAPHHGSARSDPPGFAAWTDPEWVVISGDRRSNRPEVAAAYRARGAAVLNTSQRGAVTVAINSAGLRVSTWREGAPRTSPADGADAWDADAAADDLEGM